MRSLRISKVFLNSQHPKISLLSGPLGQRPLEISLAVSSQLSPLPSSLKRVFGQWEGVSSGHWLKLQLVGVGYRAWQWQHVLLFDLGCSNFFLYRLPSGVQTVLSRNGLLLYGSDPLLLKTVGDHLCRLRGVDAYGGKGIRSSSSTVCLKKKKRDGK